MRLAFINNISFHAMLKMGDANVTWNRIMLNFQCFFKQYYAKRRKLSVNKMRSMKIMLDLHDEIRLNMFDN